MPKRSISTCVPMQRSTLEFRPLTFLTQLAPTRNASPVDSVLNKRPVYDNGTALVGDNIRVSRAAAGKAL
jgi:hypothetical protein